MKVWILGLWEIITYGSETSGLFWQAACSLTQDEVISAKQANSGKWAGLPSYKQPLRFKTAYVYN